MPAPSLSALFDFETQVETAAATFLAEATGFVVFTSISVQVLTVPRIEVECRLGEAPDPPMQRGGGASPNSVDYSAYTAELGIKIVTDNSVGVASHASTRGLVRSVMLQSVPNWSEGNLPYLAMKYMRPTGTAIEADGDLNISSLAYALIFTMRTTGWPA